MSKYILSPAAQKSLQQTRGYSLENFGKQQTNIYLKNLRDRMQYLADVNDVLHQSMDPTRHL